MNIPVNPSGCCGGGGACCGEHTVASRLVATVTTSCGTYEIALSMTRDDDEITEWKGSGSFECRSTPWDSCYTLDLDLRVECQHQGAEWAAIGTGDCGPIGTSGMVCPPFIMSVSLDSCNCYDEPLYLIITE